MRANPRLRVPPGSLAPALLLVLGGGLGCVPTLNIEVTKTTFNPKFSLDRRPVADQPAATLGTFRNGPRQSASPVFPEVDQAHRLMQGECYWLAHDSGLGAGDFVALNWEAVVEVQPDLGDGLRFVAGDNQLTLCRLDHPVERRSPRLEQGSADPLPVVMTVSMDEAPIAFGLPAPPEEGEWPIRLESDVAVIWTVELTAFHSAAVNPDRLCLAEPMTDSPEPVVHDLDFYEGFSNGGRVETCSQEGRAIRPSSDTSYVVHYGDPADLGGSALWLRPNLMVLDGQQRLARRMSSAGEPAWTWSTPILESPPFRWGENFSPNLTVQAVRFFTRGPSGVNVYLDGLQDLEENELCLRRTTNPSLPCQWRCAGAVRDGVLVFDLQDPDACLDLAGEPVEVAFTPTYDKRELAIAGGDPIVDPLSWSIQPSGVADPLYIEFDVVADVAPLAMQTNSLLALGAMARGDTRRGDVVVRNVGGKTATVDSIAIDPGWGDAGDFDAWIVDDPKPVPIPIEVEDWGLEGLRVRRAEGWEDFPVIETTETETSVLGRIVAFEEGVELSVDDQRVVAVGSRFFYDDPAADFDLELAKNVERPFHVVAYRHKEPPFNLLPGESVLVTVSVTPSDVGERRAFLRVDYHDAADPSNTGSVLTLVAAEGLWGPDAYALPPALWVPDVGPLPVLRNVLLLNNGDMVLTRTGFRLEGRDAAAFEVVGGHPATAQIQPGSDEVFRLEVAPDCVAPPPDSYRAELVLETSDQELVVPLVADRELCFP